jgi:hypothetical protein
MSIHKYNISKNKECPREYTKTGAILLFNNNKLFYTTPINDDIDVNHLLQIILTSMNLYINDNWDNFNPI